MDFVFSVHKVTKTPAMSAMEIAERLAPKRVMCLKLLLKLLDETTFFQIEQATIIKETRL